jgi:hypothetical protein
MKFSITGLILAILFIALSIYVLSRKTDGQGGALQLILTFPWFFIAMDKIPLWLGIVPNAIITYFAGSGIEWLIKKLINCIL